MQFNEPLSAKAVHVPRVTIRIKAGRGVVAKLLRNSNQTDEDEDNE
jgi:hypothetical protein